MLKTILIIIISVSIFGIIVFVLVRNAMKKRIEYYLKLNEKKKKTKWALIVDWILPGS